MLIKSDNNFISEEGMKAFLQNKWNKLKVIDLGNYSII